QARDTASTCSDRQQPDRPTEASATAHAERGPSGRALPRICSSRDEPKAHENRKKRKFRENSEKTQGSTGQVAVDGNLLSSTKLAEAAHPTPAKIVTSPPVNFRKSKLNTFGAAPFFFWEHYWKYCGIVFCSGK
ncbi:unnamed protein product, partial [Laminaria digitata]